VTAHGECDSCFHPTKNFEKKFLKNNSTMEQAEEEKIENSEIARPMNKNRNLVQRREKKIGVP
jgi:hypothetical protein